MFPGISNAVSSEFAAVAEPATDPAALKEKPAAPLPASPAPAPVPSQALPFPQGGAMARRLRHAFDETFVGTGDRMWYLAMVAADGRPVPPVLLQDEPEEEVEGLAGM